jgi:hypothetical protein
MKVNIKDIDKAFDAMVLSNKEKPEEWKAIVLNSMTNEEGIEEFRNMAKLRAIVMNFVDKQDIWCAETIYQTDRVISNAYEFIQELVEIVGYKEDEDDSDDE